MWGLTTGGSRRLKNFFAILFTFIVFAAMSAQPNAVADSKTDQPKDGLAAFGTCLASKRQGAITLLIDQSGSLRTTDPDDARIETGKYLVKRLAEYSEDSNVEIKARVAGFSTEYKAYGEWTVLGPDSASKMEDLVTQAGNEAFNYDTDYWLGFEGARQDLASVNDNGGCSAIMILTDGEYDASARLDQNAVDSFGKEKSYAPGVDLTTHEGVKEAVKIGKEDICRDTGLADQLRSSGISLLGVGLTSGNPNFGFLRSVLLGGGENASPNDVKQCGKISGPPGAFFPVDDIDSMYMAFDQLASPSEGVESQSLPICQGKVCPSGEAHFVLDKALSSVRVMASSEVDDIGAYIFLPEAGNPVQLENHGFGEESTVDGIVYTWLTPKTVEIKLDSSSSRVWSGTWRLVFVDSSKASKGKNVNVNMHLSSPMVLSWANLADQEIRLDTPIKDATFEILDKPGGKAIDPKILGGTVQGEVILVDSARTRHKLLTITGTGDLGKPVDIPAEKFAIGKAAVETTLVISTPAGKLSDGKVVEPTTLAPTKIETSTQVEPPLDFPSTAGSIDFGFLEKETTADSALEISGPGCVWIDSSGTEFTGLPNGVSDPSVSSSADSADSCVSVKADEKGELPLVLSTGANASGALSGSITVNLAAFDHLDDYESVVVPFGAEMQKPLDAGVAWATFTVALLLGIGIPLGALYLFKAATSRLAPGPLACTVVNARVPESRNEQVDLVVNPALMDLRSIPKGRKSLNIGKYKIRTRMGLSPMSAPWAELVSDSLSVSSASMGTKNGNAQLPVSLRGQWIAVLDQNALDSASVIIMAKSNAPSEIDAILNDARNEMAAAIFALREANPRPEETVKKADGEELAVWDQPASPFDGGESSPWAQTDEAYPAQQPNAANPFEAESFGTGGSDLENPPSPPQHPAPGSNDDNAGVPPAPGPWG